VCWDENLVRTATIQHPSAEFDTAGKKIHPGEITMKEIAEFLIEYLCADALGILSTRHLAIASIHGPSHQNACRLAKHIAEAVDFPKTGILPTIPNDISVREYPDFMERNGRKQFECDKALGVMYRQIRQVYELHLDWTETDRDDSINLDRNFVVQGYQKFLQQAEDDFRFYTTRMNSILSMYGLTSEYELISGIHLCPDEEKKNNDSVQTATLDYQSLINEMRTKFHQEDLR
jgi:RNA-dependent RNA polymerase